MSDPGLPAACKCWLSLPHPTGLSAHGAPKETGGRIQKWKSSLQTANPGLAPAPLSGSLQGPILLAFLAPVPAHLPTRGWKMHRVTKKWVVLVGLPWEGTGVLCELGLPQPCALTVGEALHPLFPPFDK